MSAVTIDSVIRNVYLGPLTEKLGCEVRVGPMTASDDAYEWEFAAGSVRSSIRISRDAIIGSKAEAGAFARALDREMIAMSDDILEQQGLLGLPEFIQVRARDKGLLRT